MVGVLSVRYGLNVKHWFRFQELYVEVRCRKELLAGDRQSVSVSVSVLACCFVCQVGGVVYCSVVVYLFI